MRVKSTVPESFFVARAGISRGTPARIASRNRLAEGRASSTLASTDFGNVSQVAPADYIGFPVSTEAISGHSHVMREASATDLAHTNAMLTAEMLASVAVRIATDPQVRASLRV